MAKLRMTFKPLLNDLYDSDLTLQQPVQEAKAKSNWLITARAWSMSTRFSIFYLFLAQNNQSQIGSPINHRRCPICN